MAEVLMSEAERTYILHGVQVGIHQSLMTNIHSILAKYIGCIRVANLFAAVTFTMLSTTIYPLAPIIAQSFHASQPQPAHAASCQCQWFRPITDSAHIER